jgi:hypothetical protein
MNKEPFLSQLNQQICNADWHVRYYSDRSRKFNRIDYWVRSVIGLFALTGIWLSAIDNWRIIGVILAGGSAALTTSILPNFKWDSIVSGFKKEEEEWTRILQGYKDVLRFSEISNKDEMLLQEFQRINEMQNAAALNDRLLPKDDLLLNQKESEVRKFHRLD